MVIKQIGQYEYDDRPIGQGAFASIYKGVDVKTKSAIAVKEIQLDLIARRINTTSSPFQSGKGNNNHGEEEKEGEREKRFRSHLAREIEVMRALHHPNVIELYDVVSEKESTIYLVMEFCDGGDLASYLRSIKGRRLSESRSRYFMKQLAEGLKYLRENGVIHRDLKPGNLLLKKSSTDPKEWVLKIGDFGFARKIGEEEMALTLVGTPLYLCPEIMAMKPYSSKSDLWSVGAILYETVVGYPPFRSRTPWELKEAVEKKEIEWPKDIEISPLCKDIVNKCLRKNPEDRISWEEFFTHPWLQISSEGASETLIETKKIPEKAEHIKKENIPSPQRISPITIIENHDPSNITTQPTINHPNNIRPESRNALLDSFEVIASRSPSPAVSFSAPGGISAAINEHLKRESQTIENLSSRIWCLCELTYKLGNSGSTAEAFPLCIQTLVLMKKLWSIIHDAADLQEPTAERIQLMQKLNENYEKCISLAQKWGKEWGKHYDSSQSFNFSSSFSNSLLSSSPTKDYHYVVNFQANTAKKTNSNASDSKSDNRQNIPSNTSTNNTSNNATNPPVANEPAANISNVSKPISVVRPDNQNTNVSPPNQLSTSTSPTNSNTSMETVGIGSVGSYNPINTSTLIIGGDSINNYDSGGIISFSVRPIKLELSEEIQRVGCETIYRNAVSIGKNAALEEMCKNYARSRELYKDGKELLEHVLEFSDDSIDKILIKKHIETFSNRIKSVAALESEDHRNNKTA